MTKYEEREHKIVRLLERKNITFAEFTALWDDVVLEEIHALEEQRNREYWAAVENYEKEKEN